MATDSGGGRRPRLRAALAGWMYEKGFQALSRLDHAGAERWGRWLMHLRYSGAWELVALAQARDGRLEEAERTLRKGIETCPRVSVLWKVLGDTLSDLGRHAEAHEAYDRALECPVVDRPLVQLNRAVVLSREERDEEALAVCEFLAESSYAMMAGEIRVRALNRLGRHEEALQACESLLLPEDDSGIEPVEDPHEARRVEACILGARALALWLGRHDATGARAAALEAVRVRPVPDAMEVLRLVRGQKSPGARRCLLMVEGRWHQPLDGAGAPGFLRCFEVVADSPEEALLFVADFEPPEVGPSLQVESIENAEPAPDEWKGVVWTPGGHTFFDADRADAGGRLAANPGKRDSRRP